MLAICAFLTLGLEGYVWFNNAYGLSAVATEIAITEKQIDHQEIYDG